MQVHDWREKEDPRRRRGPDLEVDFVVERLDGQVLPVEVKFRRKIDAEDHKGLEAFLERYPAPFGIMVTRDLYRWDEERRILLVPLQVFLLSF